jgi:hypothetical protein
MKQAVRTNGESRITMDDIRTHLARFGRDIPYTLPIVDQAPKKEAAEQEKERKPESPGIAPWTRGSSAKRSYTGRGT